MVTLRSLRARLQAWCHGDEVLCVACGTGYRPRRWRWGTGHSCNSY